MIDEAMSTEVKKRKTFFIHGLEFGVVTDFEKISQGEYVDMARYVKSEDTFNDFMAVCCRPILKRSKDSYKIKEYKTSKEYSNTLKLAPMDVVNDCIGFFLDCANSLKENTKPFTRVRAIQRVILPHLIFISGGGYLVWLKSLIWKG